MSAGVHTSARSTYKVQKWAKRKSCVPVPCGWFAIESGTQVVCLQLIASVPYATADSALVSATGCQVREDDTQLQPVMNNGMEDQWQEEESSSRHRLCSDTFSLSRPSE